MIPPTPLLSRTDTLLFLILYQVRSSTAALLTIPTVTSQNLLGRYF